MNDLDFDELDSAVSALVAKDQSSSDASEPKAEAKSETTTVPKQAPIPASAVQSEPPQPKEVQTKSAPPSVVIPKRPARLGAKSPVAPAVSRGRGFMDIVTPKPGVNPPARVANTVKPLTDANKLLEEAATTPAAKPPAGPKIEPEKIVEPIVDKEVVWPDPVDSSKAEPKVEAKPAPEEETLVNSTPFIPQAKVEKRPLGAYSNFTPVEVKKPEIEETKQPEATEAEEASSIPPELQPDILAVEAGQELENSKKGTAKSEGGSSSDTNKSAMMSIPQQYKVSDKPVDDSTRPIYDSKEYHPPLLEPPKPQKNRKGTIIAIAVALILLAAVGFVVYLMMFGGLDLTKLSIGG